LGQNQFLHVEKNPQTRNPHFDNRPWGELKEVVAMYEAGFSLDAKLPEIHG